MIAHFPDLAGRVAVVTGGSRALGAFAPGADDRRMTAEQLTEFGRSFPLGRVGEPGNVAAATAFLASDASSWITGTTLDISGGRIIL